MSLIKHLAAAFAVVAFTMGFQAFADKPAEKKDNKGQEIAAEKNKGQQGEKMKEEKGKSEEKKELAMKKKEEKSKKKK